MFKVMVECQDHWPENGPLHVEIHFTGDVLVSPTLARRRAAGFLATEVSMVARTDTPVLIADERPVWRVPAHLSVSGPENTEALSIGTVDVDASTGEIILPSPDQIAAMQRQAHALAASHSSPSTTTG
jgi:hypothetical protein